jgi:hypothetical protein
MRKVYTLEIVTAPPGAAVVLDGRDLRSATPTRLEGVSADEAHTLELSMMGHKTARRTLEPTRQGRVLVEVVLEPEGGASAPMAALRVADVRDPVEDPVPVVAPAARPEVKPVVLRSPAHATVAAATAAGPHPAGSGADVPALDRGRGRGVLGHPAPHVREVACSPRSAAASAARRSAACWLPRAPPGQRRRALYAFAVRRPGEEGAGELRSG